VNPVPESVMAVAVLIGPAFGEIAVRVGAAGFVMFTVSALERDGAAVGVSTFTVAAPSDARSAAGTVACSEIAPLPFATEVLRFAPFHCTTELDVKPVPRTVIVVSGDPAVIEFGLTDVMIGVGVPDPMVRLAVGEVPPPGGGLVTVTASIPESA